MVDVAHGEYIREPLRQPVEIIVNKGAALPQADPVRRGHLAALDRPRVNDALALAQHARDLAVWLIPQIESSDVCLDVTVESRADDT